ncbi:MAG: cell wall metabolism sensor histidine kinase WalK [Planctomycetia bacterium]|nr:cell wall metabolism sensor histidine kinase WalK [Planctomycetia bacterium]
MNKNRISPYAWLIACFTLIACLTVAMACTLRNSQAGLLLSMIAVIAAAASGGICIWTIRRICREQAIARRYLELLVHSDDPALASIINLEALPAVDEHSTWMRPLTQIRDYLASFHERQAGWDATRSALEVRLQRTTAQAELMSTVLANIGEPVFAMNAYEEIELANEHAKKLLHLSDGDEKRPLSKILPCGKLTSMVNDVRRRNVPTQRCDDFELDDADGNKRWYRATASNLLADVTASEQGSGVVVLLRDISVQRGMQQQHAEFVSAASHEMKTPLAGIKAYVELLADGDAEDESSREEFLGVINNQADRLQRLIENLLNIARIEAGVVKVSKQSRGVNEILNEAIGVVQPSADAKHITLVSDLSPLYLGALVDRDMLMQAVINLLSNAVKYTPCKGRVTLRSRLADQEIHIEVEDTGVGLNEEDCVKVFDKFYRVDKDKNMAAGTGLGLPLARHIVEDVHSGHLTVRSKVGVGSTFSIAIPNVGRSV